MSNYNEFREINQTVESDLDIVNIMELNGTYFVLKLVNGHYVRYSLDNIDELMMEVGLMASGSSNAQEKNAMEYEQLPSGGRNEASGLYHSRLSDVNSVEHQNNEQDEGGNRGSSEDENHQTDEI